MNYYRPVFPMTLFGLRVHDHCQNYRARPEESRVWTEAGQSPFGGSFTGSVTINESVSTNGVVPGYFRQNARHVAFVR